MKLRAAAEATNAIPRLLLMNGIRIRRLAFAHLGFRVVDLLTQGLVLRIKVQRLLPRIHRLGNFVHLREGVANVFKYNRIVAGQFLRGPQVDQPVPDRTFPAGIPTNRGYRCRRHCSDRSARRA